MSLPVCLIFICVNLRLERVCPKILLKSMVEVITYCHKKGKGSQNERVGGFIFTFGAVRLKLQFPSSKTPSRESNLRDLVPDLSRPIDCIKEGTTWPAQAIFTDLARQ